MPGTRAAGRRAIIALAALAIVTASAAPAIARNGIVPPEPVKGRSVIVTYDSDAAFTRGGRGAEARAEATLASLRTKVFRLTPGKERRAMLQLAGQAGVASIENDSEVQETLAPNDPYWPSYVRWAHNQTRVTQTWDVARGTSAIRIAILDSGLQVSHPEFLERVVAPWDFVEGDSRPNDPRGHGTMSGGAAAAKGNNGKGVAGPCWNCRIIPVRVLNAYGTGYASNVIKGIAWAADHGADVISMSFGGFAWSSAMQNAISYARNRGAVVLASAGNEGNTARFYPGAYAGVISVAANRPDGTRYSWSNYGSWVDLTAPGCFWTTKTGSSYGNFCGTSASTPLVAGIVGILRGAKPTASVAEVEKALLDTAVPKSYVARGLPNAWAALGRLLGSTGATPTPTPTPKPTATPAPTPTATPAPGATPAPTPDGDDDADRPYRERNGRVVMEAENGSVVNRGEHRFSPSRLWPGYAGSGYISALPDRGGLVPMDRLWLAPELRFPVRFTTTGTYRVFVRGYAPDKYGNSVHVGINGRPTAAGLTNDVTFRSWAWASRTMAGGWATITVTAPGVHTVSIWMREDGYRIDRVYLTTGSSVPSDIGPAESKRDDD